MNTTVEIRNARGEWTPEQRATNSPLFERPIRWRSVVRWLVGIPGFLFPWNVLSIALAGVVYAFATPSMSTARTWAVGWVLLVLMRNLAITIAWYGLFHLRLYTRKRQDTRYKYNNRWPRTSDRFTFGSQNRENVFWTLASGVPIWTAYEVIGLWLYANGHIPWLGWSEHPGWFVLTFVLTPFWLEAHFYVIHRLIHIPRNYRVVHALHHRNTNPGPWSGLSMHPIEHVLYFSAVTIHWVIPSTPLIAMYNLFRQSIGPAPAHSGFDTLELGDTTKLDTGALAHYLHHKYFEVNYGDGAIPFDRWFGTFHDGSPDAHAAMKQRLANRSTPTSV